MIAVKKFLFAFAFFCFQMSAFSGVVCSQNGDGSWTCSGTGTDVQAPPLEVFTNVLEGAGIVISNDVGICTNCVNMTPQACDEFKLMYSGFNDSVFSTLNSLELTLIDQHMSILEFMEEGKTFTYNRYGSNVVPPEYESLRDWITSQPQYAYYISYALSDSYNAVGGGAANNSIYVYFNERVLPFLEDLEGDVYERILDVQNLELVVDGLGRFVDGSIDCSECTFPLDFGGGGEGGEGGEGGQGGAAGGGCPCKEQIKGLQDVMNDVSSHVWSIASSVDDIITYLDAIRVTIADGFGRVHNYQEKSNSYLRSISNTVYRLDSYVQTDLDDMMKSLIDISSNIEVTVSDMFDKLKDFEKDFVSQFAYANDFKNKTGGGGVNSLVDVQTNFVSESEYKNLPWFLRVELLLLKLVHPFEGDDSFGPSDSQQDEANDIVNDLKELDPSEKVESFKNETGTVLFNLKSTVRNVAGVFDVASLPASVELMHQGEWIGDSPLVLNVDPYVADNSRLIFGLVWACLALFLFFKVWLGVVRIVLPVFDFIRKLLRFALKA